VAGNGAGQVEDQARDREEGGCGGPLARNSPAIGAKKAPKLYMVPKTTKPTVNATSTMTQARRESGRLASDGEYRMDTFTTFLAGGRKSQNTKHVAAATLRFVLSFDSLIF
jgi:hypothetical protein